MPLFVSFFALQRRGNAARFLLPTAEGLGLVYFFCALVCAFFGGLKQKAPFKKARKKHEKKHGKK